MTRWEKPLYWLATACMVAGVLVLVLVTVLW